MLFKVILSALQRTLYWGSLLQKYCNQIFNVWLIPQSARTTDLLIPFQGESESEVSQSCPTLRDPMDCSLPGSSSIGFSRQEYWQPTPVFWIRRSSWPRNWTQVSHIVGRHFTVWATREIHITRHIIQLINKVKWLSPSFLHHVPQVPKKDVFPFS